MKYTSINIQGNLISEEILQKIENSDVQGQQGKDFGFDPGTNLRSEIEYAWSKIKLDWKYFFERIEKVPASDPYGTSLSRKWMTSFFNTLGFDLTLQRASLQGDNQQYYNISHTCDNLDGFPVHIVGFFDPSHPEKNTLDIRSSGGTSRLSPHATIQEYLNVTEYLYAMATNGLVLRFLRDSGRLVKMTYIEFDLKRLLEEDKYSEFTLIYRLLHASRFPKSKQDTEECLIEKYYQDSIESGNRIRDGLSSAVKESLISLGKGLLQHDKNNELRNKIINNELSPKEFYRQLLRLVYRLLFLMVIEERDLIYDPEDKSDQTIHKRKIYFEFYSINRIRKLTKFPFLFESKYDDLWQGLLATFRLFEEEGGGINLGIKPLAGELFNRSSIKDISECNASNSLLLQSIRNLNEFVDENRNLVSINYRALDVEELGSVYEGLLELHPVIENIEAVNPFQISFLFHEGTERKTTGSYYTRPDLVNELIKSALIPIIKERLKQYPGNKELQEEALLKLKVCDPAAGSGHMILAAARTIAWELACIRTGEGNPAPSVYRSCLREVIQHCVYGVDMNPDAVELCKLSLWLESHNNGKPISFLDHKIRCGNSLVGLTDLSVLKKGIPDNAFNPVTGDDKDICRELKRANASFRRTGQFSLYESVVEEDEIKYFSTDYSDLERIKQDDLETAKKIQSKFEHFRRNQRWLNEWTACNIWTSAFFYTYTPESKQSAPLTERLQIFLQKPAAADGPMVGKSNSLAIENRFFHWPLEFPDVFEQGGFDVMLGNPPWERIKLQEQEFFANRDPKIANARTASERKNLIKNLPENNPTLYQEFIDACHDAEASSKFIREGGRFDLTARGDINTYAIFAELFYRNIHLTGLASIILPTGIATDSTTSTFFSTLMEASNIKSLYDFVNEKMLFPAVLHNFHFALFTICGNSRKNKLCDFSFNNQLIEHLQQEIRHFPLSFKEIEAINPESKTLPAFTSKYDSFIVLKIHSENNILAKEGTFPNVWNPDLFSLFHMTNDSSIFLNQNSKDAIPLYEAKMFYQYDHRYGTYNSESDERFHMLPKTELRDYINPIFRVTSSFYVPKVEVGVRVKDTWEYNWFLAFRSISSAQLERTFTATILPYCGVGNSAILTNPVGGNSLDIALLLAAFNSFPFDYVTRQKTSGANLNFFKVRQLPLPAPKQLQIYYKTILPLVIELTYSSWDIKCFADDVWKEADENLKVLIKKQSEENRTVNGGHEWKPPEWCEIDKNGCPLPPFKWDEDRRAVLKAELDAIYAKLYGLTSDELRYILDPQDVYGPDFPGETFRVLKEKEIRNYGEYRTKRLVMEAWERLNNETFNCNRNN